MVVKHGWLIGFVLAVAGLTAQNCAVAATSQQQAFGRWKLQDKCVQTANKAHPDHTPASLLMRDQAVQKCLEASGQPPRDPLLNETKAADKVPALDSGAMPKTP